MDSNLVWTPQVIFASLPPATSTTVILPVLLSDAEYLTKLRLVHISSKHCSRCSVGEMSQVGARFFIELGSFMKLG